MNVRTLASAGTLESSDAYVEVLPSDGGVTVEVESIVKRQFGAAIEASVREVVAALDVASCEIRIHDRGALDCVIRARVETAIRRAGGDE